MAIYSIVKLCRNRALKNLRLFSSTVSPDIDLEYFCNSKNTDEINRNISLRKGVGDIQRVLDIYNTLQSTTVTDIKYNQIKEELSKELQKLPNRTHPKVQQYEEECQVIKKINEKKDFSQHPALEFSDITRRLNLMRTDKLGHTCGHKSYYFLGELAELEEALIKYTVTTILKKGFQLVSVPDILPSKIIESCGMAVNNDRTQVCIAFSISTCVDNDMNKIYKNNYHIILQIYSLDPVHHGPDLLLSGTAEMSLAGLLMNSLHSHSHLPLKLAAVSRCYRAETSNVLEERGIYR